MPKIPQQCGQIDKQGGLDGAFGLDMSTQMLKAESVNAAKEIVGHAGAIMGVIAAALALAFMHFHWGLKKVYLRFGLHVRPHLHHVSVLSAPLTAEQKQLPCNIGMRHNAAARGCDSVLTDDDLSAAGAPRANQVRHTWRISDWRPWCLAAACHVLGRI